MMITVGPSKPCLLVNLEGHPKPQRVGVREQHKVTHSPPLSPQAEELLRRWAEAQGGGR